MGAKRLAQTLVAQQLLSHAQVVGALQRQALIGGSLDTNLLELQLLPEATLLDAMAQAFDAPAVDKAYIESIGLHLARLFTWDFVVEYDLVPVRLEEQILTVLGCVPPEPDRVQRIWERYQLQVVPLVTVEPRLRHAMQRLYHVPPEPRFAQLLTLLDGLDSMVAAATLQGFDLEPAPVAAPAQKRLEDAMQRLETEPDRDGAIVAVIEFARTMFDYVGIFILLGSKPHGWRSGAGETVERANNIDVQLIKDSVVRTIHETQSPYLGPLPRHDSNERFLQHIGRPWPKVACLTPILVGGRVAALMYADNGERLISADKVAAVMNLLQRCGMVWERLIRDRKRHAVGQTAPVAGDSEQAPPVSESAVLTSENSAQTAEAASQATVLAAPVPIPAALPAARSEIASGTPPYVMFSEVTDSPQQSLGDWQDVYVEVSRHDDGQTTPRTANLAARWSDVVALARSAGRLVPLLNQTPRTDEAHIQFLLTALDSPVGATRHSAMAQLLNLGSLADGACYEAFPGRLSCDIGAPEAMLPPFSRCSGLCHLLVSRGQQASGVVVPHLAAEDPTKRLMAVYFFQAVYDPAGCPGLTLCLYDTDKRVRHLAVETLRNYKNDLSYAYTVQVLREQLQEPAARRFAIQTLGQLREVYAVPALIPLVAVGEADIARAAASALAVICGQAFGNDVERWQSWWRSHHYQPRPAWLLDGLSHANPTIRRVAHLELQHITGQVLDFDPQASAREREQRTQVWQHWLQTHDLASPGHRNMVRA